MQTEDILDSWERMPHESSKAYQAFMLYRDLGPGRSLTAAHKAHKAGAHGASGQWTRWSSAHEWKRRAEDYDIWHERQLRIEREKEHREELKSYRERQKKLAQVSLSAATALLSKAGARLNTIKPEDIPAKSLGTIFRAAAMLAQAATEAEGTALSVGDLLQQHYEESGGEP